MPWQQGSSRTVVTLVVVAALGIMCQPGLGAITTTGSLNPAYDGTSDPWSLSTDLTVGSAVGVSSMTVAGGSDVHIDALSFIGSPDALGILATVTLTDPGSTWMTNGLLVGPHAEGRVTVSNGGALTSGESMIGGHLERNESDEVTGFTSGEGTVTVTGPGSTWQNDILVVGTGGNGRLDITDGGQVSAGYAYFGDYASALGIGTITGSSSR